MESVNWYWILFPTDMILLGGKFPQSDISFNLAAQLHWVTIVRCKARSAIRGRLY